MNPISIFKPLFENNISVDMIVQNVSADNKRTDVTFTIKREDLDKSVNLIKNSQNGIGISNIYCK